MKPTLEEAVQALMNIAADENHSIEYRRGVNHAFYLIQQEFIEKDKEQRKQSVIDSYIQALKDSKFDTLCGNGDMELMAEKYYSSKYESNE